MLHDCTYMYGYFENVGYFSQAVCRPLAKCGRCYLSLPLLFQTSSCSLGRQNGLRWRRAEVRFCFVFNLFTDPSCLYCAFQKQPNSEVQKLCSQLCFSLPSIMIRITSSERYNTETHKTGRNPPVTNHKPLPFELVEVNFCFPKGLLRWFKRQQRMQKSVGFELQNSHVFEKHSNS